MILCIACSSTISDEASSSRPSYSEKPDPPPIAFECGHLVCGQCQVKQRRLARSCIMCESAHEILAPASDRGGRVSKGDKGKRAIGLQQPHEEEQNDFVLGDSDDEMEQDDLAPPPGIDDNEEEHHHATAPPAYDGPSTGDAVDEKRTREQNGIHYLQKSDTLVGLAMQYKVEGPLLCSLNKLPLSTLSTTPHLLHTLPFLLLPPTASSISPTPLLPPALERRRLIVRRFQMHVKCDSYAMAQAYVDQVFTRREREASFVSDNRRARGDDDVEVAVREGGELEEAIEAYRVDEKWEKEQDGKMGSRLKSTGRVEAEVKGWGLKWPR